MKTTATCQIRYNSICKSKQEWKSNIEKVSYQMKHVIDRV